MSNVVQQLESGSLDRGPGSGPSTSIQSSTAVTLTDGPATAQELEPPPAEVVPAVAPPSLEEVQQAVQEASEQVESRGAEEVLKELLERVVEAVRGQVEVGGEGKADEEAVREASEEDDTEEEEGGMEAATEAEMLEQAVEEVEEVEEVEARDIGGEGGYNGVGEEQEVAVVDALEVIDEAGEEIVEDDEETVAGPEEETTAGGEADVVEVIEESLGPKVNQIIVEDTVVVLEETEGYLDVGEARPEEGEEQAVLSEEKGASESETQEVEETPAAVEVATGGEPQTVVESDPSLTVSDVEQIGDMWGNEETQVDELESDDIVLHYHELELETTHKVVGEPVEELYMAKDDEGPEEEEEQVVLGGGAAEDIVAEGKDVGEASVTMGESVVLENEGGDQPAGEEEQIALETSHSSEKEDQGEICVVAQRD
ncbi:hypothetical protein EYF80_028592 [Liparis tanakae]|uniref:Uncharacterized protein n=1 Tax=Liparis tanakae TaxID=230148 RepID=A0A4Z2H5Q4_9TELE|nr:hypothetical protein EYF80_028592 [Liparis tanakae]